MANAPDDGKSNPNVIADAATKLRIVFSLVVARSSSALLLVAPRLISGRDEVIVGGDTTTNPSESVAVEAARASAKNLENTIVGF